MPEGDAVGGGEFGALGQEDLGPAKGEKIPRPQRPGDLDPKVKEVYRLLRTYMEQPERKAWLRVRRECWDAVYENQIWTEKEKKAMEDKGMVPLSINDCYQGVRGSSAVVTDQKPGIEFLPVGSGDLYVAELMKRAHDQVWAQNDGGTEWFEMVKEAKLSGLASMDAKHDPSKGIYGKCVFGNFDPETLYYDMKKARKSDLSDVHLMKAHCITRKEAKELYEEIKDDDLDFTGVEKDVIPDKIDDYKTGEDNYAKAEDVPASATDIPEEKEDVWEIEAHILKKEIEYWLMTPQGPTGEFSRQIFPKEKKAEAEAASKANTDTVLWKRLVEKREMRIIVGKKLITELVNPHGIDSDGDPVIPIITLCPEKTRKGKPVSPTVFAKEASRERNKRRSQAIYVVSKNVDAPIVTTSGYKWEKDKVHGDIFVVDRTTPFPPSRLVPGTISQEAMSLEAVAKADVQDFYDMQDVMKGKVPAGDPSGRTILALQDSAGMMSKPFVRALEASLVRFGKVNMAMILKNWQRVQWERLIEPDEVGSWIPEKERKPPNPMEMMGGEQEKPDAGVIREKWMAALEQIKPSDPTKEGGITLLDVDVRVAAGSTMPTNRMARAANAMEMVKVGIYDAEAALDYLDDPKKDEIAARMKAREQAMMAAGMTKGMK